MNAFLKFIPGAVIFSMAFFTTFSTMTDYVRRTDEEINEIHAFYGEPENSIDVLFMGSSPMLRGISPMVMWNNQGFTSYVRASALQAPFVTYGLLAESLEYQTPELVVLLADNIFLEFDYAEREGDLRRALDGMKNSKYKIKIVSKIVAEDERQTLLSYMFPLFRYHEKWKEFDIMESEPKPLLKHSFKKGNAYIYGGKPPEYFNEFVNTYDESPATFNDESKESIEKTIKLCQENNIPVLIIHMPKLAWSNEHSQALEDFAQSMKVDFLDLGSEEILPNLNLDLYTDFYDQGHLNIKGSKKLSGFLGDYLENTYNLPDHRNDVLYESWKEDYIKYLDKTTAK